MVSGFLNDAGPGKAAPPRGSRGLPTCVGSLAPTLPTLGLAACPGSLLCAVSHRAGTPGIPAAPAQPALPWGGGGVADLSEGQPTGRSGVTTAPPWPCPWGPWGWCQVGGHGTGRRSGIRLGSGPPLWLWAGPPARGTPLTHPWSRAADELELIRPSVYRNVARQLNLSLQSETVVTDAFLAVATQIFSAGEASCLGRGPTVPAGPGAWELSGPGLQHRWACLGLQHGWAGSEGDGPLVGFWGCPGRKSWLAVCVRPPAGAAARLGFLQCGAHSLAAGVGAARLLEPEKLWGCYTGVCWAEARCQPAPHGSGALQWGVPHLGHLAGP